MIINTPRTSQALILHHINNVKSNNPLFTAWVLIMDFLSVYTRHYKYIVTIEHHDENYNLQQLVHFAIVVSWVDGDTAGHLETTGV